VREVLVDSGDTSVVDRRTMPLQSLGFGHAGAVDKLMCLASCFYLEYGPDLESMRDAAAAVRIILSDPGTEAHVGDLPCAFEAFLCMDASVIDYSAPMFPLGLRVMDWSHLMHWLAKESLQQISWFDEYLRLAKGVTTFMRTTTYVDTLVSLLRESDCPDRGAHETALRSFKGSFAKWRFGSVKQVAKSISSVRGALRAAWLPKKFAQARGNAEVVTEALESDMFWHWNWVVEEVSTQAEDFRQWGLGCPCHPEECATAAAKVRLEARSN
jgi:hypothetical protein